jgi:trk system potassium uptake protein TrkA
MRIVFVGGGEFSANTARLLVERGHEVVIIEADRQKIDELSADLDCSFLHGDGSRPHLLREVDPKHTDLLFCLTDNDQQNIIASLVGRTLGFTRVVTRIHDPDFETICLELGLENTIIPSRTISRYLADMVAGVDILELSTVIKGEARFFHFKIDESGEGNTVSGLELPDRTRAICYYRDDQFALADADTKLRKGDELVLICHSENLAKLEERFVPETAKKSHQPGKKQGRT